MAFEEKFYQAVNRLSAQQDFQYFVAQLEVKLSGMQGDLVKIDPQRSGEVGRLQGRIAQTQELLDSIHVAREVAKKQAERSWMASGVVKSGDF